MASEPIITVVRMMESLPEPTQNRVADHLRDYLLELQDEIRWDEILAKSQPKLAEMARRAKEQIAEGKARPLNFNEL
jgi:hypothetical protein